jgi:hypothetical protein
MLIILPYTRDVTDSEYGMVQVVLAWVVLIASFSGANSITANREHWRLVVEEAKAHPGL